MENFCKPYKIKGFGNVTKNGFNNDFVESEVILNLKNMIVDIVDNMVDKLNDSST